MTKSVIPSTSVPAARRPTAPAARTAVATPRPLFSFLTSAYRTEDVIGRTIASVLAQTRGEWELVIVDNGRSDAMAAVVAPHLSDPRITLVRRDNDGVVGGQTAAAAVARGRYLVLLNSDDALEPDFCERMAAAVTAEPHVAAVSCDAYRFADPGERRMNRTYLRSAGLAQPPDPTRALRLADVVDGPCPYYSAAIRRDVWDALGGLASATPLVSDLDFWLRALVAGHEVRVLPDVLGRFRVAEGSESRPTDRDGAERYEAQRQQAFVTAVEQRPEPDAAAALDRVLRRLRHHQSLRRARTALRDGDPGAACGHVEAAHAQRPGVRTAALALALRVAPRPLRLVHPVKRRLQTHVADVKRFPRRLRP